MNDDDIDARWVRAMIGKTGEAPFDLGDVVFVPRHSDPSDKRLQRRIELLGFFTGTVRRIYRVKRTWFVDTSGCDLRKVNCRHLRLSRTNDWHKVPVAEALPC